MNFKISKWNIILVKVEILLSLLLRHLNFISDVSFHLNPIFLYLDYCINSKTEAIKILQSALKKKKLGKQNTIYIMF